MSIKAGPEQQQLRRRYPRRGFHRKMGILFEGKYWLGNGVELGEGGISFLLGQSFPEGRSLVINFQVPSGAFVTVQAEIRNVKKDLRTGLFSYGTLFKTLKFENKKDIRSYVSARSESEQ